MVVEEFIRNTASINELRLDNSRKANIYNNQKMHKSIKRFLKSWLPPILIRILHSKDYIVWTGDYKSWEEAKRGTTGYDNKIILNKVKESLLKVKNNEAVFERDSMLFYDVKYSWPLLAGLMRAASENHNRLSVLDFGGSLGSSYFQNRAFLSSLDSMKWSVVEQVLFVDCGRKYFQNEQLRFYKDIDECISHEKPNVLIASSVLPYLERPYDIVHSFIESEIPWIIIDRTPFVLNGRRDRLSVQKVPPSMYDASYPAWFLDKNKFLKNFEQKYSLIAEFDAIGTSNIPSESKGFIFVRK